MADAAALPNYSTIHVGGRHEYRRKDTDSAKEPRNNADAAGSRTWCVVSGGEQMGVRQVAAGYRPAAGKSGVFLGFAGRAV